MRKITFLIAGVLFVVLLYVLNYANSYLFMALEQNQLLVYSWQYYLKDLFFQPGGPMQIISAFVIQFFRFPYMGAILTSAFLTGIWVATVSLCRSLAPKAILYVFAFVPVFFLVLLHLNFNYHYAGSLSFLFILLLLYAYAQIARYSTRLWVGVLAVPILFWIVGPVSCVFAVYVLVWEVLSRSPKSYRFILLFIESLLLTVGGFYLLWLARYNDIFFYSGESDMSVTFYLPWASLVLVLFVAWLLRRWAPRSRYVVVAHIVAQTLCLLLFAWQGTLKTADLSVLYLMKYDFHTRRQEWNRIISTSKGVQKSYFRLGYLNMALASEGLLAEQGFRFDQKGIQGLVAQWDGQVVSSTLLSDVYFALGNIGMAQAMAFESNINSLFCGKPRMLQRLVQTNLIYGAWPVAGKYLNILEKTLYYKDWAKEQRRFLYDDAAVEADPLLGEKRKNLIPDNHLSGPWDPRIDLQAMAQYNPHNKAAVEYLGMAHLLTKNLTAFKEFLTAYYPLHSTLPTAFQEAFLLCYADDPDRWGEYTISTTVVERFEAYNDFLEKNRTNSSFAQMAYRSYGDTYWFYNMFKM